MDNLIPEITKLLDDLNAILPRHFYKDWRFLALIIVSVIGTVFSFFAFLEAKKQNKL